MIIVVYLCSTIYAQLFMKIIKISVSLLSVGLLLLMGCNNVSKGNDTDLEETENIAVEEVTHPDPTSTRRFRRLSLY